MKLIQELARRRKRSAAALAEADPHDGGSSGSGMGFAQTSTMPNILGGRDEYRNGVLVSQSQHNILGGFDTYRNGTLISQSRPNIFGGFDKNVFSLHGSGDVHALEHVESALSDILGYHGSSEDEG